ncbi:MAG: 5-oxoprolinase subunit C family protein [Candidatus Aminicenantales bacterium]
MPYLRTLKPGFLTTVQDLGRFGFSHLGISASGAADSVSLRIGNRLLDNEPSAPALEMTLVGGEFQFEEETAVAVTGSDFKPELDGKGVPRWASIPVRSGQVLRFGAAADGARCYLCVRGGFTVDKILGSASTHLLTGLGGFRGRALQKGDALPYDRPEGSLRSVRRFPGEAAEGLMKRRYLRVTDAPQTHHFTEATLRLFTASPYQVCEETNRMGLRLTGPPLPRLEAGDMITEGVPLGAVQVSHDGSPIILFVEHQTTGGYPKIATVIAADIHRIGQLRPRDTVRFLFVSVNNAHKFRMNQELLISGQSLAS